MFSLLDIFTKMFFPGNLYKKIREGKLSPDIAIMSRGDGSQAGIEYVDIKIHNSQSVILVNHGRLRTLDHQSVSQWREWGELNGFSILLHNYPGYGNTPGPVTVNRIMADLEILVKFLKETWSDGQISLLGNSLGCGPTLYLAAREKYQFKKVVLISPFISLLSLTGWYLSFFRQSRFDPFDSSKLMHKLKDQQVFMISGEHDKTIPSSNSKTMFKWLEKYSKAHDRNRLCILPGEDHRYTRLKALDAIAFFLSDSEKLDEEVERLKQGGIQMETSENIYSD